MSKLDELIQELCPDGVEYKTLGEICNISRGRVMSKDYIKNNIGQFPVYSSQTENNGELGKIATYDFDGEYLTWTTDGANAGSVFYRNGKFSITNVCGLIEVKNELVNTKYLYYALTIETPKYVNSGMGNPKLMSNVMVEVKVPVPPLEVQCELVRILDKFRLLTAELTARRKQYEYYMGDLLFFGKYDNKNKVYNLGELCTKLKGIAITAGQMKKITSENGEVRIFAGGKTRVDVKSDFINNDDIIKVPNIIVQSRGIIDFIYYDKPCSFKKEMWSYTNENNITLKYIYYYLKNNVGYFRQRGSQMGSMPQISLEITEKYKIPILSIYEQEKIVNILDRFDKLCNDITSGIPAEIELNNKRYEYYRDKLLNFKEKK